MATPGVLRGGALAALLIGAVPLGAFMANTGAATEPGAPPRSKRAGPTTIATAVWRCRAGELFRCRVRAGAFTGT
jgi:hypothetical protein